MEDSTEQPETESKAKAILVLAAALVGGGAFLAYHLSRPEPAPQVAAAPTPPKPPPPVEPPPPAPTDPALTDTLLGLNQPEPDGLAAMQRRAEEAAALKAAAAAARKRRARAPSDPGGEEDLPPEDAGGLSDAAFHDTVERWRGLKSCLAEKNKRPGEDGGALRVAFTIASSGEVVSHRIFDESNDAAKALTPCLDRQLRGLRFPAFDGSKPDTKEAKFVF